MEELFTDLVPSRNSECLNLILTIIFNVKSQNKVSIELLYTKLTRTDLILPKLVSMVN